MHRRLYRSQRRKRPTRGWSRGVRGQAVLRSRVLRPVSRKHGVEIVLLLLFPLTLLLQELGRRNPKAVEYFYSRGVYHVLSFPVSRYFALFPFSAAEILVYTVVMFAVFLLVLAIKYLVQKHFRLFFRVLLTTACILTSVYFVFTVLWGLNYSRQPLEQNLGYQTGTPTESELSAMMQNETNAINALCGKVDFNKEGHSVYPGGFAKMRLQVNAGYQALSAQGALQSTLFGGARPYPKSVLSSKLMSYAGIEGIFFPFTGEPNVDTDDPAFVQPFDAAHESAHFKGFAREDEANFIAYLADCVNPDPYFQYSAHMEAYLYLSNALYSTDNAAWKRIAAKLDPRAQGDFVYYNDYVQAHENVAQNVSNKVNDNYLKAQGQQGVITYDMFVNLLADRYRSQE